MRIRVAGAAAVIVILAAVTIWTANRSEPAAKQTELIIAAAASLKGSLETIAADYAEVRPDVSITVTYGSTGLLKQQIEQGAPVDLFILADTKASDELTAEGLVDRTSVLLANQLVLIVSKDAAALPDKLQDLKAQAVRHLAIGQPETVPAGRYAKETLEAAGLWNELQGKLVFGKDVRQVLTYVETGNADAGFVYKTDAAGSGKVRTVLDVPAAMHAPIRYPAGIVGATKNRVESEELLDYLGSEAAMSRFTAAGFLPVAD